MNTLYLSTMLQVMSCSENSNTTTVLQPSLPFDGCVFKNKTYKQVNTGLLKSIS